MPGNSIEDVYCTFELVYKRMIIEVAFLLGFQIQPQWRRQDV